MTAKMTKLAVMLLLVAGSTALVMDRSYQAATVATGTSTSGGGGSGISTIDITPSGDGWVPSDRATPQDAARAVRPSTRLLTDCW